MDTPSRNVGTDVGIAVLTAALLGLDLLLADGAPTPFTVISGFAGALVLAVRTRFPLPVLLATVAALLGYTAAVAPEPIGLAPAVPVLFAVYTAVDAGHLKAAAGIVGPVLLAAVAAGLAASDDALRDAVQTAILPIGWFVAAGVLGQVSRQRRAYVDQAEQRAAAAERTREEAALRRAGQERLRIARELHDSLTHSISVIKVQAGVAVHLARKRGEEVSEALLAIQDASTVATRELRETLDVLRDPEEPRADTGLRDLPALLARSRAAGVPAELSTEGVPADVPPQVGRAAYRIVQEALTNTARHAGPATATVRIRYGDGRLTVRVGDTGSADPGRPPVPGTGLRGMRERVTALSGTLRAGPEPGGGFGVEAVLPFPHTGEAATADASAIAP